MKKDWEQNDMKYKKWVNSHFYCKECGVDHKKLRVVGWTVDENTDHRPKVFYEPNGLFIFKPDYYCWSCSKKLKLPFTRKNAKDNFYPAFDDII